MELLKIRDNKPYKDRNGDVEFLRDFCCLYFKENLEWEFYLNGERERGQSFEELQKIIKKIVKEKKQRQKTEKNCRRRLVIWSNSLSILRNYYLQIDKGLEISKAEKFIRGSRRLIIDKITNDDLEFRNFELLAGENLEDVRETYGFKGEGADIMISFIKKREEQGLKGWGQIRYTAANNNLKLFYRKFNKETLSELRYESIKRIPSYEVYQILNDAPKAGVMMANQQYLNKQINNVYSYDISSAYNSQFVRGDDFPIGRIKKADTNQLLDLYKENKWFLLVMKSEEEIKNVPPWLKPVEKDDIYYYVIGNYDYKCIKTMGGSLSSISKKWKKYKLFTCEETGRLNSTFRQELNSLYKQRQYLKSIGSKEEKIYKQIAEVLYGKGIQKRNFSGNSEIHSYYQRSNSYINAQISFHALQRTRYEIIMMLDKLNWSYVACDTDSIKTINPAAPHIFEERNREILQENQEAGIDSKIGIWKAEGLYPNFIQFGNKVYAYEYEGKINCKFAGCLTEASSLFFSSMSKDEGLAALNNPELIIPNGIIVKMLKVDDNDNFFIEKKSLGYRVRGGETDG